MKRMKLFGISLVALSALSIGVASAESSFLPEGTVANPVKFKFTSGAGILTSAKSEVKCTSAAGTSEVTSKTSGKFSIEIKGCEEPKLKIKCASLNTEDKLGTISATGTFALRMGLTGQSLKIIAHLFEHIHILCSIVLLLLLGCLAGSISPINSLVSEATLTNKVKGGTEKSINEITTVDNEAETGMEEGKMTIEQGGESSQAGLESTETASGFEQGGKVVNGLIMI
jgi:hypothetical protein